MGKVRVIRSKRVVLDDGIVSAAVVITSHGIISEIITGDALDKITKDERVLDLGDAVILPGLVDSHVHVNEPGRTEWEGFWTATQAAAAAGVTTIVDMPLNSIPPTTTVANFQAKLKAAQDQIHVDTAFWGGLVPTNHDSLVPLVEAGVVGFKCFLCPSGVDEFPHVDENDVRKALATLTGKNSLLAFHAEIDAVNDGNSCADPALYKTFLDTRPAVMETSAVDMVCKLSKEYNFPCHIVHASSSEVVNQVKKAKEEGAPLTVETCYHYLSFNAENVPKGQTFFKCCPPIRDQVNQESLWSHVMKGDIPLIVSDHSPCSPILKCEDDFLTAWGGISSLQFGLSVMWTYGAPRGISLLTISRLLSSGPAKLCRLSKKGAIAVGKDADFVVFDPDDEFVVSEESYPCISAYEKTARQSKEKVDIRSETTSQIMKWMGRGRGLAGRRGVQY